MVVLWDDSDGPPVEAFFLSRPGATKQECHAAALEAYRQDRGDLPDVWYVVDDDVVPEVGTFDALAKVLDADVGFGLAGPWHRAQEPNRGQARWHTCCEETIQHGTDFVVGGAVHAIPRRTLETIGYPPAGPVPEGFSRHDDFNLTQAVRAAGMQAVIVRSRYVILLLDDGQDPDYARERQERDDAERSLL